MDNYFLSYTIQILAKIMDTAIQVIEIITNSRWQANAHILPCGRLSHLLPIALFYSPL